MKTRQVFTAPALPPAASRVGISCGPGEFPKDHAGTVLCHVTDRWGTHAVVLMDNGKMHCCHGLVEVGIGTYQL